MASFARRSTPARTGTTERAPGRPRRRPSATNVSRSSSTPHDRQALSYPKLRERITAEQADCLLGSLRAGATLAPDPVELPKLRSRDPGDDYLIALAAARGAMLVTGDSDLLALRESAPIRGPREALETFAETGRG